LGISNPGRTEEDDRVLDLLAAEARQWFDVLRKNTQNPPVRTLQKLVVVVGEGGGLECFFGHKGRSLFLSRLAISAKVDRRATKAFTLPDIEISPQHPYTPRARPNPCG